MTPDDRKYAATHEWLKLEGETAIVGITDHAQQALGDITFIELPPEGEKFAQGAECAVIESVKAASDIYAPVSGEICAVNNPLEDSPEMVNTDPYNEGWLFKMKNFNPAEIDNLMDAAGYEAGLA